MGNCIGWNFPGNNDGQITGIADAGIETFKGSLTASLTREICQNSLDAFDGIYSQPVRVEFEAYHIATNKIPEYQELLSAVNGCSEFWKDNEKAIKFFYGAKKTLKEQEVCVMRISDFNTKGLVGSDQAYGTPWQNLVKSNGVSDKGGTAGGSFGIGKSAPFACSKLRTVIYRTLDRDGVRAVQGISRLASFEKDSEEGALITTTGIGYYGNKDRNQSVPSVEVLDELFARNEKGTDIFVVGFDSSEDWENEIVNCLVEDFLLSFVHGHLEVKVGSQHINKENIGRIITANQDNLRNAYYYYQVLNLQNETHYFTEEFNGMGKLKLRVLLGDSLNRRVLISRSNGMKLRDKGNISNNIQFSAVFEMEGEELISYFRKMENPQHDKWETDRVKDYGENPKEAQKIQRELQTWIKTKIQELGKYENGDQMDAQGIGDFIPDFLGFDENSGGNKKEESLSDLTKEWEVHVSDKPIILQSFSNEVEVISHDAEKKMGILDDEGKYDTIDVPHKDHNDYDGATAGPAKATEGDGNRPFEQNTQVRTFKTRMFVSNADKNEYTLSFCTSKDIVNGLLKIKISGEQSDYDANIKTAIDEISNTTLAVSKNHIAISGIKKNTTSRIKFHLLEDELFSLEVKLYEN